MIGNMSQMGIGLAVYLDDQFTQQSQRLHQSLGLTNQDVDRLVDGLQRIDQFGGAISNLGMGVFSAIKASVNEFAKFEDVTNSVRVIAELSKTDPNYGKLVDQTKELSYHFGVLPANIAEAQLELSKAGKKPTEILAMTKAIMALGAATGTAVDGVNGAAEIMVNTMQAFNAPAREADKYAAVITAAANQSTIDVNDFFQSMRYSADIAQSLKIPVEDVATSIATLGNMGLKGSIAGTSYANMLRYLAKALGQFGQKRQQEALGLLNLTGNEFIDEQGNLKQMSEILDIMGKQMRDMNSIKSLDVFQGIFGVRGSRAASPLLKGIMEDTSGNIVQAYDEMSKRISENVKDNVHLSQAEEMLDDLDGDIKKMGVGLSNFKIAIGQAFGPLLRPIFQRITKVLSALTEVFNTDVGSGIIRIIGVLGVLLIPLGKILSGGARFATFILTSAGKLSEAFLIGRSSSAMISSTLKAAATDFLLKMEKAALAIRGIRMSGPLTGAGPKGGGYMMPVGPTGKFTGGRFKRNWLTRILGTVLGKTGLKWGANLTKLFSTLGAAIVRFLPFLPKLGGAFSWILRIGGRLVGVLLSWWAVAADLILLMTTGKGLFEWLWEVLKLFGNALTYFKDNIMSSPWDWVKSKFSDDDKPKKPTTPFSMVPYQERSDAPVTNIDWDKIIDKRTPEQKTKDLLESGKRAADMESVGLTKKLQGSGVISNNTKVVTNNETTKTPVILNLTVNPTAGGVTKKTINLDAERGLNSYAIS